MNRKILKFLTISFTAGAFTIAGIFSFVESGSANSEVEIRQNNQIAAARSYELETETNKETIEEIVETTNISIFEEEEETESEVEIEVPSIIETEAFQNEKETQTEIETSPVPTSNIPQVTNIQCNGQHYEQLSDVPKPAIMSENDLMQMAATNAAKYGSQIQELVSIVNNYRIQNGIPPLTYNTTLTLAAEHRASESAYSDWNMVGYTSDGAMHHYRPTFEQASSIFEEYNLSGNFGENYARYFSTSAETVEGWKNSKAHNALMLNEKYKSIGAGIAQDSDGYYYYILLVN